MAQINYSREKLENMSQRTIKQAQSILEKYSKDPKASPLDKQNWEATSQHLSDVSAKIDQAWEVAKSYGVTFGGKSKDLLTLAEIHELTQEQIHDSGKTASKITDIMDKIDSMKIGTSEKEKFKVLAKDKDLSGNLATGLLGCGIAEMALSALGIGKAAAGATAAAGAAGATAAGGTAVGAVLGTVVPGAFQFLGNAVVGLWNLSNPAFLAISLFAAMKVIPHVKSFMSKHGARKEKEFSNELDAISAQNQDGVRKKQERTPY